MNAAIKAVTSRLRAMGPVMIAVSGGLDSRLLSHVAARAGIDAVLVHFTGPHMTMRESGAARDWMRTTGLPWRVLEADILAVPQCAENAPDRCYHCKKHLFTLAGEAARGRVLADGGNASDLKAHRPGRAALAELGVHSPMARAGLRKSDVRAMARELGLPDPDQPARPCLLTRLDYGLAPELGLLDRLGRAEDALAAMGLRDFRLRIMTGKACALYVSRDEGEALDRLRPGITDALKSHGFGDAEIVLAKAVSGLYDLRK